jgi:hypothetical protein
MSRGTVSSQSVAPATGVPVSTDAFIQKHLDETRQQVKFVEISTHLITLFTIALSYLLIAAVVDHWIMPLGTVGRVLALLVLIGGMGYYIYQFVFPLLLRKINPLYAARTIEKAEPSLKNSLINFLQLRQESGSVPQVVLNAMESRAANDIATTQVDNAVDRRQLLLMGYVLAGVIALVGMYRIASAKNPFTSFYRVLIPWASVDQPSRVQIEDVEPGDTLVRHGKTVEVTTLIRNLRQGEEATLYYSTSDGQIVDQAIPLTAAESGLYFSTTLPPSGDGIQQAATYRIEAGDVVTRDYAIEVQPNPTILLEQVTLDFPSYTKRERKVLSRQGDIRAVEGTRVTLVANTNSPIKDAYLQLEGTDNGKPIKRRVKMIAGDKTATHSFILQLKSDRSSAQYSTYRLDFSTVDGQRSTDSVTHHIYVLPDLDPEVEILNPEKSRTKVPVDGMQTIEVRAIDPDFGLRRVVLRAVAGGDELFTEELFSDSEGAEGQQTRYFQFSPKKYRLQPGDVVSLHARAEDNRVNVLERIPAPNSQRTPVYSLVITESTKSDDPSGQPGNGEDPTNADPKNSDPKNSDPKNSDPKNSDPKNSDPKNSDPKNSDPKNSDPKNSEPESGDPESEDANNDEANDETNSESGDNPDSSDESNSKSNSSEKPESGDTANNQTGAGSEDDSKGTEGSNGNASQSGNQDAGSEGDSPNDSEGGSNDGTGNSKSNGSPNGNKGTNGTDGNTGGDPGNGSPSDSESGSVSDGEGSSEPQHPGEKFEEILEHMKKNGQEKPNTGANNNSPNANSTQRPTDDSGDPNSASSGVQPKDGDPKTSDPKAGDPKAGDPKAGDPKAGDPKAGDPKTGDPKTGDPKTGDPKSGDPKSGDANNQGTPESGNPKEDPAAGNSTTGNSPTASEEGNKPKEPNGTENPESNGGSTGNKPDGNKPGGESDPNGSQPQPDSQKTNSGEGASGGTPPKDAENKPNGNGANGEEKGPQGNGDEGKPGAGEKGEGNTGSTPSEENEDRNKTGSGGSGNNGPQDPSTANNPKKQSSSEGDASGDKNGGGKKGDGQSAGQKGNENAGSNSPNDEGANAANEQGNGETGSQGGTQQKSDEPTGTPGNEKGNGSESRPASDGDTTKPGQKDSSKDGSNEGANGNSPSQTGQPSGKPQGKHTQQTSDGQPGGGGNSVGDEVGNGDIAPDGSLVPDGEAANLDYTRKATDMAIDYLEDQKHNPDPELLKKMNWSKNDLNKFVDKWKQLKTTAVEGEKGKHQYDDTLRGLGLREQKSTRRNSGSDADGLRGLSESGHQTKPPSQYQDLFRAFKKGTARAD